MMRGETGPDFIEALARGLDVIRAFEPNRPTMTLSEVAAASGLARPTARRMLLTLEELGYVRVTQGGFALTPRVLELGMAYIGSTRDRKSTRLNSSHQIISYAVFCLKKKKKKKHIKSYTIK